MVLIRMNKKPVILIFMLFSLFIFPLQIRGQVNTLCLAPLTANDLMQRIEKLFLRVPVFHPVFFGKERLNRTPVIALDLSGTIATFFRAYSYAETRFHTFLKEDQFILRPGIYDQLTELKKRGYRLIIWTAEYRQTVLKLFMTYPELISLFDLVITNENYDFLNDDSYEKALEQNPYGVRGKKRWKNEIDAFRNKNLKDISIPGYQLLIDDSSKVIEAVNQKGGKTLKVKKFELYHEFTRGNISAFEDFKIPALEEQVTTLVPTQISSKPTALSC